MIMKRDFYTDAVILVVGKTYEELAKILNNPKHVNEFIIAKKLDITINQTRNLLYKLSDQGIVSSLRKKDKKKGWYTYFWKLEELKSLEFLRGIFDGRLNHIEGQIKIRQSKEFFVCNTCHCELTQEEALNQNFTCNECGNVFEVKDNSKMIKDLTKLSDKLKLDISEIDSQILVQKEKIDKGRDKEMKKEKKEKEKIKLLKKQEREKERAKLKKDTSKKKVQKTKKKIPIKKKSKK